MKMQIFYNDYFDEISILICGRLYDGRAGVPVRG